LIGYVCSVIVSSTVDRDREKLRRIFDQDPALYDRARPRYPEQLFDDLLALGSLQPGDAVLEIGCGTGQATSSLAQRGCRVVCVEIGEGLASVARRNLAQFPNVEVATYAFEDWEPSRIAFSMVFAASSWHWLDPGVRYLKAASALKSGGSLAIVSGGHAFPENFDPFFTDIQECYNAIGEGVKRWPPARPDEVADEAADIERSGLFGEVRVRRYLWSVEYGQRVH
jgi:SAM-dependent methyltransferase